MARRDRGTTDVRFDEEDEGGGLALDTESPIPPTGPHDSDDLDPEVTDAEGLVDFGSIRVPVPPDGTVTVEPTANGRMQAVHVALPEGRLSVSALAAPKTSKLWPELSGEIDASLRESGARVRSFPGHWGRELHATSGGATSVFVGVDGARWMLYGVATGPSTQAAPLDAELRRMLRGTVVVRGKQPYPVRTILPLTVPDHLAAEDAAEDAATPMVTATGSKKRSPAKAGAGKSAPGKAASGKTAPPNSDATTAAANKAAARRVAARKAAAAAAVKAAAAALAEQAAEDRAAAGEHPGTGSAARTGAYPASGTIPTGPGPDAPLREQAPSARRAAAAAWRTRPGAPGSEVAPPTEAVPVARPVDDPPMTEAFPAAPAAEADLLPTEALRVVEPGSGGRRRLGEPGPASPPSGRRRLQEPPVEELHPGGRRRLREPSADLLPDRRYPRDPQVPVGGRRRLPERDDALGATAPWDLNEPGGRRRLHEPVADTGVSASGRRRLRESWEPSEPAADAGISTSGRRRLQEPRDEGGPGAGSQPWEAGPGGPNGSGGRRRLDESLGYPGADPRDAGPARGAAVADTGASASGRRRLREPWDEAGPLDAHAGSNGSVADTGASASGRRRLRDPRDEAGPDADSRPWETPGGSNGTGGRRRLGESPGLSGAADTSVSASGRRRLRESWDEAGPDAGRNGTGGPEVGGRRRREPLGEPGHAGPDGCSRPGAVADTGVSASGRRRLREPWDGPGPAADTGESASGRRRLREPWDEGGPGPDGLNGSDVRSSEPEPVEPTGRRRAVDAGEDPISGTGGRRRLREPEPAPVRDGSQTEPWLVGPGSPGGSPDHSSARRTLRADYLIDTGEQDAGWAAALDDYAERRDGGRHAGADNGSPPTVRLETLLSELDPNRPRRRHRR